MNTEEEIILRKFLGDHKFDKLIMNESLWLVCQAMKAYKNIPKLVKNLSLSGASKSVVCGNCDGYGYTVDENGRRKEHCNECEQQQIMTYKDKEEYLIELSLKHKKDFEDCKWWQFKKKKVSYRKWQSCLKLVVMNK